MQWVRDYLPQPKTARLYRTALLITVCGNVLLAGSKGLVAYLSGSVALFADAANSISDVVYSLLMVLGLWMAQRPPDLSHPQGHGRFEPLVGLVVTASMTYAGFEAARASLERFASGGIAIEPGLPLLVLIFSAGIKTGMYFSIVSIARRVNSPTLKTTARDNISDVLTSMAALAGTVGSTLLSPLADPIAGIMVAGWIFRNAFIAGRENLGFLTGAGASEELRQQVVMRAKSIKGVRDVHFASVEYVGPKLVADLHINLDGDLSLERAHAISDQVIAAVEELPDVDRVYVHLEPLGWK